MMYQKLPPFNPVANATRASLQVPRWAMTLGRVVLCMAGSITKTTISEITVKIGARVVFGPISGLELDKLNKYRGIYDDAAHLSIDFNERDGLSVMAKEIGGIDIPSLGKQDIFVEVVNTAAVGTPTLYALGGFTGLQFNPKDPKKQSQLMHKVLKYIIPNNGGTLQTWTPNFGGAIVKRVAFAYAGTDWTAGASGNLKEVLLRKNGVSVSDNISCLDMRFLQNEQRKVPQSRMYMLDFIMENINSAALATRDARSLQFDLVLTAPDTVAAFVEVLDVPNNL